MVSRYLGSMQNLPLPALTVRPQVGTAIAWSKNWFYQYESALSRIWKIQLANALLPAQMQQLLGIQLPHEFPVPASSLFNTEIFGNTSPSDWRDDLRVSLIDQCFNLSNGQRLRYCPTCLSLGYHSHLQQLGSLHRCPIHPTEALLSKCLVCNEPTLPYALTVKLLARPFACSKCHRPYGVEIWSPFSFKRSGIDTAFATIFSSMLDLGKWCAQISELHISGMVEPLKLATAVGPAGNARKYLGYQYNFYIATLFVSLPASTAACLDELAPDLRMFISKRGKPLEYERAHKVFIDHDASVWRELGAYHSDCLRISHRTAPLEINQGFRQSPDLSFQVALSSPINPACPAVLSANVMTEWMAARAKYFEHDFWAREWDYFFLESLLRAFSDEAELRWVLRAIHLAFYEWSCSWITRLLNGDVRRNPPSKIVEVMYANGGRSYFPCQPTEQTTEDDLIRIIRHMSLRSNTVVSTHLGTCTELPQYECCLGRVIQEAKLVRGTYKHPGKWKRPER